MPLSKNKYFLQNKENKRKKERKNKGSKWARHMLACQLRLKYFMVTFPFLCIESTQSCLQTEQETEVHIEVQVSFYT